MSNEITYTLSLSCYKPAIMSSAMGRSVTAALAGMSGNYFAQGTILVATGGTAIPLGQITAPHWAWFKNLDPTNYITIRNGSGGADVLKLLAGEACVCPLMDTSTPYAFANTAACLLEYLIFSL